jgi:Fe2+ or Zn2+ uptake regulation protein
MTSSKDKGIHVLHDSGFRITGQRRTVLDVINQSEGPLTAEAVYQKAKEINPKISLATVYRTLTVLRQAGLIEQHFLPGGHERSHFEPVGVAQHFHFLCTQCGKIIEFEGKEGTLGVLQDLAIHEDAAQPVRVCACVEGYCKSCVQERTSAT